MVGPGPVCKIIKISSISSAMTRKVGREGEGKRGEERRGRTYSQQRIPDLSDRMHVRDAQRDGGVR